MEGEPSARASKSRPERTPRQKNSAQFELRSGKLSEEEPHHPDKVSRSRAGAASTTRKRAQGSRKKCGKAETRPRTGIAREQDEDAIGKLSEEEPHHPETLRRRAIRRHCDYKLKLQWLSVSPGRVFVSLQICKRNNRHCTKHSYIARQMPDM